MKMSDSILDYNDKQVVNNNRPVTVRSAILDALNFIFPNELMPSEQKFKLYQLSLRINQQEEPEMDVEEKAVILERVGKFWNPLVYGKLKELIK